MSLPWMLAVAILCFLPGVGCYHQSVKVLKGKGEDSVMRWVMALVWLAVGTLFLRPVFLVVERFLLS